MVVWISGQSKSGKSTLARKLKTDNTIILDGNDWRDIYPTGFSKKDRWEHNIRIAKIAQLLDAQGFDIIVAFICPYKKLREEVRKITGCKFIYLEGGIQDKDYPYEL